MQYMCKNLRESSHDATMVRHDGIDSFDMQRLLRLLIDLNLHMHGC